jgi:hypothetical protein
VATPTATPKWQFRGKLANGTEGGFMLNTDFELVSPIIPIVVKHFK